MFACACAPPLQPGDELWAIAPSGALRELTACQAGVDLWRAEGYRVKLVTGFDAQWGYLAGTDGHRRQLLQAALADPACKGILCVRGGYGGTRLLETWQWPPIAPKWLIGFSDITSLLWSLSRQGVAGVHGPLLTTLAQEPEWSRQRLFAWVRGQAIPPLQGTGWGGGRVTGRLLPANLTVAT
ncbi:MAG TPA: LD-carboxypeptidase, partial [Candidatus Obscuribacterales bacterium]